MIYRDDTFLYDGKTGKLYWGRDIVDHNGIIKIHKGTLCGGKPNTHGYQVVKYQGHTYSQHRLIWSLIHGRVSRKFVSHLNGIRTDNREINLAEVTRAQSHRIASFRRIHSSGCPGVTWNVDKKNWNIRIRIGGKNIPLGHSKSFKHAVAVYKKAAKRYGRPLR